GDVSQAEGNTGQTAFRFTVSLDRAQPTPVSVDFSTADGTATTPGDYTASNGTVSFAPGETTQTITVQVICGTTTAEDKTYTTSPSHAPLLARAANPATHPCPPRRSSDPATSATPRATRARPHSRSPSRSTAPSPRR